MEHEQTSTGAKESRSAQIRRVATRVADTAVGVVAGADAVVRQAGLTTRDGRISKSKVAMALLRPRASGGRLIKAAAIEIDARRNLGRRAPAGRTGTPDPHPPAIERG